MILKDPKKRQKSDLFKPKTSNLCKIYMIPCFQQNPNPPKKLAMSVEAEDQSCKYLHWVSVAVDQKIFLEIPCLI